MYTAHIICMHACMHAWLCKETTQCPSHQRFPKQDHLVESQHHQQRRPVEAWRSPEVQPRDWAENRPNTQTIGSVKQNHWSKTVVYNKDWNQGLEEFVLQQLMMTLHQYSPSDLHEVGWQQPQPLHVVHKRSQTPADNMIESDYQIVIAPCMHIMNLTWHGPIPPGTIYGVYTTIYISSVFIYLYQGWVLTPTSLNLYIWWTRIEG